MIRSTILMLAAALPLAATAGYAVAAPSASEPALGATDPAITPPMAPPTDTNPVASAVRTKLNSLPTDGSAQELKERAVLSDFYAARRDAPMWLSEAGLTEKGAALGAEILEADNWGLNAKDFDLPVIPPAAQLDSETIGKADVEISLALLKYARYARGGRITEPSILLNSNLDRKPQLLDPELVIIGAANAADPAAYVRGLHPQHPQFEKLRQALLANKGKPLARTDPRQHGRVAVDGGPGRGPHHGERAGVHGLRREGRSAHPQRAHRRRRDRQADVDLHPQLEDRRLQADVARARFHQGV